MGHRRINIDSISTNGPPAIGNVTHWSKQSATTQSATLKAHIHEVLASLRELIALNPLLGEQFRPLVENTNWNDPYKLADFASAITTADGADLQKVIEYIIRTYRTYIHRVYRSIHSHLHMHACTYIFFTYSIPTNILLSFLKDIGSHQCGRASRPRLGAVGSGPRNDQGTTTNQQAGRGEGFQAAARVLPERAIEKHKKGSSNYNISQV
jgi:hypothetical protein